MHSKSIWKTSSWKTGSKRSSAETSTSSKRTASAWASNTAPDTGPLDILCVSKDKKTLLVVELKKGKASDTVVGQVLRYMGYVQEELAEDGQSVRGVIIALEDGQGIRRALAMVPAVSFYRYEVSFRLMKSPTTR